MTENGYRLEGDAFDVCLCLWKLHWRYLQLSTIVNYIIIKFRHSGL